jgi:hypothetical protein
MNEKRKQAYRYLLYQAMIYGKCMDGVQLSLNPFEIRRQNLQLKNIGGLDSWLHNLAFYNYTDEWDKFSEKVFWEAYEFHLKRNPEVLGYYKEIFEQELERLNKI